MMRNRLMSRALLLLLVTPFAEAYQRPTKIFRTGQVQTTAHVESFSTDTNYDSNGQGQPLSDLGSNFVVTNVDVYARYSHTSQFASFGSLTVAAAESNNGVEVRSNSGLSHFDLGGDFLIMRGFIDLIAEGAVRIPVYKVTTGTDSSLISEGSSEISGTLQIQKKSKSFFSYAWGGYLYRDGGRSSLVPYGLGSQVQFSKYTLGAEVEGFAGASEDDLTATPSEKTAVTDRVNAGSLRYYSINPSQMIGELNFKYKIGRASILTLGAGTTLSGVNTAYGHHFYAGLEFSWQAFFNRSVQRPDKVKALKEFKETTEDGVDQSLFEDVDLSDEIN